MKKFLTKLFAARARTRKKAPRRPQLGVERLDDRILMTVSATLSGPGTVLNVSGDNKTDIIKVSYDNSTHLATVAETNSGTVLQISAPSLAKVQFTPGTASGSYYENLTPFSSSFTGSTMSATWQSSKHRLVVSRTSGAEAHLSLSTSDGNPFLYEAASGNWYLPGNSVSNLSSPAVYVPIQGGDHTYSIHLLGNGSTQLTSFGQTPDSPALRKTFVTDFARYDGHVNRAFMLDVFNTARAQATVTPQQYIDLKTMIDAGNPSSTILSMDPAVYNLAEKVLGETNGADSTSISSANASINGNLKSTGDTSAHLGQLVNQWFYGTSLPALTKSPWYSNYGYQNIGFSLFHLDGSLSYTDVTQGNLGDCYLLAGLAEVAARNPQAIKDMFTDNGDGTFTVRFFTYNVPGINNGTADYVTVNRELPVDKAWGGSVYAGWGGGVWVALAEKAYAQMNAENRLALNLGQNGQNTYDAIAKGNAGLVVSQITGHSYNPNPETPDYNTAQAEWNAGNYLVFTTTSSPADPALVKDHAYAVLGVQKSWTGGTVITLYNPWGNFYTLGLNSSDSWIYGGLASSFGNQQAVSVSATPPSAGQSGSLVTLPGGSQGRQPQGVVAPEAHNNSTAPTAALDLVLADMAASQHRSRWELSLN
jgi:hypothetical protein